MNRTIAKAIAAAAVTIALIFGGCSGNPAEEISDTEITAETEAAASVTLDTVTFCGESDFSETEDTAYEHEELQFPKVIPAEELYDTYPVKIIYPERQDVSDKVKTEILQEDIYNSEGVTAVVFFAEYPVLFGYDETVCQKINDTIKEYVDGNFERMRKFAEELEISNREEIDFMIANDKSWAEMTINMDGIYFDGYGCDINGNIFTVYFAESFGYFGSAHGSENPVPMMFDLRTGDKIIFSELVDDKNKMHEVFAKTERRGALLHGTVPYGERNADEMQDIFALGISEDDKLCEDDRIMVVDGCIGFLLAPYESGSFADGVRFWHLPASEFIPYMNDKGKSLFEGYVSADSEPAKVIEYKGKRWFDITEWIPLMFDSENLTEGDREFISLFENAEYYLKKYGAE